ncbi:MAG: choice-of-anchor L domain-containing protein [Leptolyngbyaceae cyanobacterium]
MRFITQSKLAIFLTAAGISALAFPAQAFTVTQNDDFADLLSLVLGDTTGLTNITGTTTGNSDAFGTFNDSPFGLETGVVLSTGIAEEIPGENTVDASAFTADLSTAFENSSNPGALFDSASFEVSFDADETVDQLLFQYVFGSEEFLDFAGSSFNDFFTLELNGVNLALLNDSVGEDNLVNVNNLAASPAGPFSTDYIDNPAGPDTLTKLDGYTQVLTFTGDVITGSNTLTIQVADVSDGIVDSAVFIRGESLRTIPVDPEAVPEPAAIASLLLLGCLGLGTHARGRRRLVSGHKTQHSDR